MTIVYNLEELEDVAKKILNTITSRILIFYGDVGAGKTTLIKALVKEVGSTDIANSPTFSLVNEYKTPNDTIFHLDLYRIKTEEELYDIGIETYLQKNNWLFIEWPDYVIPFLQSNFNTLTITTEAPQQRVLKIDFS